MSTEAKKPSPNSIDWHTHRFEGDDVRATDGGTTVWARAPHLALTEIVEIYLSTYDHSSSDHPCVVDVRVQRLGIDGVPLGYGHEEDGRREFAS